MKNVDRLFVQLPDRKYQLNPDICLQFGDIQESSRFLVEAIRYWRGNGVDIFCSSATRRDGADLAEDEWVMSYGSSSDCGSCRRTQKVLDKIFRGRNKFDNLPFNLRMGNDRFTFRFEFLKCFSENGKDAVVALMSQRKAEEEMKKKDAERAYELKRSVENASKLAERLGGAVVSQDLRLKLSKYAAEERLTIVSEDIAVVATERHESRSGGGIGYFDQVHVICGDVEQVREWQWRDFYDQNNDARRLRVARIGEVVVTEGESKTTIEVELFNYWNIPRKAVYEFKR